MTARRLLGGSQLAREHLRDPSALARRRVLERREPPRVNATRAAHVGAIGSGRPAGRRRASTVVERAEESAEARPEARPRPRRELHLGRLVAPAGAGAPKNGHGKRSLGARRTSEPGSRREAAERAAAAARARARRPGSRSRGAGSGTPTRSSTDPDRVVPALAQRAGGEHGVELRELLTQKRAHERLVDDDVCIPLGHRGTLAPDRAPVGIAS